MSTEDFFLPKPTLSGSLVELRPFDEESATAMLDILRDPEVLMKTGSVQNDEQANHHYEISQIKRWYSTRNEQPDRLDLAIYCKQTKQYVGEVVFNEYDSSNHSVNYRIAIGEQGRGRGLGTEATQLMIDYGFEKLGLNRISLEVYDFNKRARYVYTSCGFVAEGRLRQTLYYNGEYHDSIIKSIIRSDWEKQKDTDFINTATLQEVAI